MTRIFFLAAQRLFCLVFFLQGLMSCSLNYSTAETEKSAAPEFTFYGTTFTRTENNKKIVRMTAAKLEQYSGIDAMYIKDVKFSLYDSNGSLSMDGSCGLLSADKKNDLYHFFYNVQIHSYEHDAKVLAENLRWNNKTETLQSSQNELVSIFTSSGESTYLKMQGKGFKASGLDLTYSFFETVQGSVTDTRPDGF